jgi:hypothetical protein
MKPELMGLLLMAVSIGMAQAAQPERPRQAQTVQVVPAAAPTRGATLWTSPERKAEAVRRMFWLALSLRSGG